jgi:chromosome segregation ATPase
MFCDFAINIIEFSEVMNMVGPMEKELAELAVKLVEANDKAQKSEEKVFNLNAQLSKLKDQYDKVNKEKEDALKEAKIFQDKASLASRLVNALKSEYERWKESIIVQKEKLEVVSGDVLLSAAFIS